LPGRVGQRCERITSRIQTSIDPDAAGSRRYAPKSKREGRRIIVEAFHGVRWVDVVIHRLQRMLGIGLVVEIVRHLHEAKDLDTSSVIRK
jgi:hypothetical protein